MGRELGRVFVQTDGRTGTEQYQQVKVVLVGVPLVFEAPRFKEVMEVLVWATHACSRYWRTIYGAGIWLDRSQARQIVSDGWAFTVPRLKIPHGTAQKVYKPHCLSTTIKN